MTKVEKIMATAVTVVAAINSFNEDGTANIGIIGGGFFDEKNKKASMLQYKLIDHPDFTVGVGDKNMLAVCKSSFSKHLWIMMALKSMFPAATSFKLICTNEQTATRMMKGIGKYKKNPEVAINGIISSKAATAEEVRETFRTFMTEYYGKGTTYFFSSKNKETRIRLTWWTNEDEKSDEERCEEYVATVHQVTENKKAGKETLLTLEDGKVVDSTITMYSNDIKYAFGGGGAICGTFPVNNGRVFNGWTPDGMSEEEAKEIKYLYIPPCIQVIDCALMIEHKHTAATIDESDICWISAYDFLKSCNDNWIPYGNPAMQTVYTLQLVQQKQADKKFSYNKPENGMFDFTEENDMTPEELMAMFRKNLKDSGLFNR